MIERHPRRDAEGQTIRLGSPFARRHWIPKSSTHQGPSIAHDWGRSSTGCYELPRLRFNQRAARSSNIELKTTRDLSTVTRPAPSAHLHTHGDSEEPVTLSLAAPEGVARRN